MDLWQNLLQAICLMLVLEGIFPFLSPAKWRHRVVSVARMDDRSLRRMGLVSMLFGAGLLALIK